MAAGNKAGARVVSLRLSPKIAEGKIRLAATDTDNVIWGDHILERMDERGFTDVQVLEILRSGYVTDMPEVTDQSEWKCKVVKELKGRRSAAVITVILRNGRLFLKTVMWKDFR